MTLIEVLIALSVLATVLLGAAGALIGSIEGVQSARELDRGTLFLETVLQDLSVQPYDALLGFDGNQFHDGDSPDSSRFEVDLSVFLSSVDLLQIDARLIELSSGSELGHISTLRARP